MFETVKRISQDLKSEMKSRDKESRIDFVVRNVYDLADWYYYKNKERSNSNSFLVTKLIPALDNNAFAKAMASAYKENKENIPVHIVPLLTQFIDHRIKEDPSVVVVNDEGNVEINDKVITIYSELVSKMTKKAVNLFISAGIPSSLATQIAIIAPIPVIIRDEKDHVSMRKLSVNVHDIVRAIGKYYRLTEDENVLLLREDTFTELLEMISDKQSLPIAMSALASLRSNTLLGYTGKLPDGEDIPEKNSLSIKTANDVLIKDLRNYYKNGKKKIVKVSISHYKKYVRNIDTVGTFLEHVVELDDKVRKRYESVPTPKREIPKHNKHKQQKNHRNNNNHNNNRNRNNNHRNNNRNRNDNW